MEDVDESRSRLEAALHMAAAAPATTRPVDALVNTLASTCPQFVTDADEGGDKKKLNLPTAPARALFDAALRRSLAGLAADAADAGVPLMEHAPADGGGAPALPRLLDLALELGGSGAVDQATALAAIEDAVDLAPSVTDAGAVLAWVEAAHGEGRLGAGAGFHPDRSKLGLLRTANALLRRASRVDAAGLRGSTLLFLARACPLADKSGLNLLGAINTGHPVAVPPVPEGAADCAGRPIDADLYTSFWGLQARFRDPYSLLKPEAWKEFVGGLRAVLSAYRETPFAVGAATALSTGGGGGTDTAGAQPASPTTPPPTAAPPVVEYLAAPALFPLQLADPAARRPVLLQGLITLHALRHLPPKIAASAGGGGGGLPAAAAAEASALEASLFAELARTPPDGPGVAAGVAAALAGEGAWSHWKHGRAPPCPPFERAPAGPPPAPPGGAIADPTAEGASPDAPRPAKRAKAGAPLAAASTTAGLGAGPAPGAGPSLGTPDLDRLWSLTPAGPASCLAVADRGHAPPLRDFLGRVALEMDPDAGVEAAAKAGADPVYLWKALRLLARADLATFGAVVASRAGGKGTAPGEGLELAVRTLFPGDVPDGALEAIEAAKAAAAAAAAAAAKAAAAAAAAETPAPAAEEEPAAPPAEDEAKKEEEAADEKAEEEEAKAAEAEAEEAGGGGGGGGEEEAAAAVDEPPPAAAEEEAEEGAMAE